MLQQFSGGSFSRLLSAALAIGAIAALFAGRTYTAAGLACAAVAMFLVARIGAAASFDPERPTRPLDPHAALFAKSAIWVVAVIGIAAISLAGYRAHSEAAVPKIQFQRLTVGLVEIAPSHFRVGVMARLRNWSPDEAIAVTGLKFAGEYTLRLRESTQQLTVEGADIGNTIRAASGVQGRHPMAPAAGLTLKMQLGDAFTIEPRFEAEKLAVGFNGTWTVATNRGEIQLSPINRVRIAPVSAADWSALQDSAQRPAAP
ncbi:MAG: hypothetical protein AB7Q97_21035 [Gammaproteobacteria bacterium]